MRSLASLYMGIISLNALYHNGFGWSPLSQIYLHEMKREITSFNVLDTHKNGKDIITSDDNRLESEPKEIYT